MAPDLPVVSARVAGEVVEEAVRQIEGQVVVAAVLGVEHKMIQMAEIAGVPGNLVVEGALKEAIRDLRCHEAHTIGGTRKGRVVITPIFFNETAL